MQQRLPGECAWNKRQLQSSASAWQHLRQSIERELDILTPQSECQQ
jgi:hypothetical protein